MPLDTKKKIALIVILLIKVSLLVRFIPLKLYFSKYFILGTSNEVDLQPFEVDLGLIDKVVKHLPWTITCLIESIAVQTFLKQRGVEIPIYLGIAKTDYLTAHAWYNEKESQNYRRLNF